MEKAPGTAEGESKLISFKPKGKMTHLERTPPKGTEPPDQLAIVRNLDRRTRTEIRYSFYIHYTVGGNEHHQSGGQAFTTTPSRLIAKLVEWYVFARGAIVSPWFFDQATPFRFGWHKHMRCSVQLVADQLPARMNTPIGT
jgi:hypothetical protein